MPRDTLYYKDVADRCADALVDVGFDNLAGHLRTAPDPLGVLLSVAGVLPRLRQVAGDMERILNEAGIHGTVQHSDTTAS